MLSVGPCWLSIWTYLLKESWYLLHRASDESLLPSKSIRAETRDRQGKHLLLHQKTKIRSITSFKSLVFTVRGTTCINQWLTETSNSTLSTAVRKYRGCLILEWRLILFLLKTCGDSDLQILVTYYFHPIPLFTSSIIGKETTWDFRDKILEIIWPVPHLQVKNLGSEKVSALPCWLVTKPELELRPWTFTQELVPLIHSEPRSLALDKYLFGKDYVLLRDIFPLILFSLRIYVMKT